LQAGLRAQQRSDVEAEFAGTAALRQAEEPLELLKGSKRTSGQGSG